MNQDGNNQDDHSLQNTPALSQQNRKSSLNLTSLARNQLGNIDLSQRRGSAQSDQNYENVAQNLFEEFKDEEISSQLQPNTITNEDDFISDHLSQSANEFKHGFPMESHTQTEYYQKDYTRKLEKELNYMKEQYNLANYRAAQAESLLDKEKVKQSKRTGGQPQNTSQVSDPIASQLDTSTIQRIENDSVQVDQQSLNFDEDRETIDINKLQSYMRDKRTLYQILSVEGNPFQISFMLNMYLFIGQYYLPTYEECSTEFMSQMLSGDKKFFLRNDVKTIDVPKLSEFSAIKLQEKVSGNNQMLRYLPKFSEKRPLNREYLCNIINTVDDQFFKNNIPYAYKQRKDEELQRKNGNIEIKKNMLHLIMNSNQLAGNSKGRVLSMLKKNDRSLKRRRQQISGNQPNAQSSQPLIQKERKKKTEYQLKQKELKPNQRPVPLALNLFKPSGIQRPALSFNQPNNPTMVLDQQNPFTQINQKKRKTNEFLSQGSDMQKINQYEMIKVANPQLASQPFKMPQSQLPLFKAPLQPLIPADQALGQTDHRQHNISMQNIMWPQDLTVSQIVEESISLDVTNTEDKASQEGKQ